MIFQSMNTLLIHSINMNGDKYYVGMGEQNQRPTPCHQEVHSWAKATDDSDEQATKSSLMQAAKDSTRSTAKNISSLSFLPWA